MKKQENIGEKGWKEAPLNISIPLGAPLSADYTVPGLRHRSIVDIIKRVLTTDPNAENFHLYPHKQHYTKPGTNTTERVYGDIFSSDSFIRAHEDLQKLPGEPGCDLERVVIGLQFWSDATVLTNFGSAKLWPVYMSLGNQNKYERNSPLENAAHDVAHIPFLPDNVKDFILRKTGKSAKGPVLTHCRRELFHQTWTTLLDDEFLAAYQHGMVIKFADGVTRRAFPRILTYSADYPEKVLIATIRDLGLCPCPRCTVKKADIGQLGTDADAKKRHEDTRRNDAQYRNRVKASRREVYDRGKAVNSAAVDAFLKEFSEVPTNNAFLQRLGPHGFDVFKMLVVDLLHEFEIGEWKTFLAHLIRILTTLGEDKISELDDRYRKVPPFGRDTIRSFADNVSEMKRLAARDYEDILQVCTWNISAQVLRLMNDSLVCHSLL
ncbi:hypothetical protein SISNIDRAFT_476451 [Sistotremastrum niveocremeum HHB9708]|uniref:Uncharacterized protein n=1 Tax=Sistotremastrum niveocremeum HHB9708 TaxID=1314777 RepID=A0A164MF58_9AGAM|nr:hypothetical protein SISNIDRAFT_476451 [Sistotremastrum niveocremeum HHB9708]